MKSFNYFNYFWLPCFFTSHFFFPCVPLPEGEVVITGATKTPRAKSNHEDTVIEKGHSLHIGLQVPFTNLPFGICAIYFDLKVSLSNHLHSHWTVRQPDWFNPPVVRPWFYSKSCRNGVWCKAILVSMLHLGWTYAFSRSPQCHVDLDKIWGFWVQ